MTIDFNPFIIYTFFWRGDGDIKRGRERRTGEGGGSVGRAVGVTSYLKLAPSSLTHHIMSPSLIIPQSLCDFIIAESNVWFAGDTKT